MPGENGELAQLSHLCYSRGMATVASRELRNNTRELLARVEHGEDITITVAGRPVAVLRPVEAPKRWMPRDEFVRRFAGALADPGLRHELRELAPDTTDDLDLP